MTFQKKEDMWMYSNEKEKGKESPKEFQKKKTYGYTQQKGKKRSSLHLRDIFNE